MREENRNKIKTLKIAYITEQLSLTEKEAEKFWPIYNVYEDQMNQLRGIESNKLRKEVRNKGGINNLTEKESKTLVLEMMSIKEKMFNTEQSFRKKLLKVPGVLAISIPEKTRI